MTETKCRSAAKALTWRLCGSFLTGLIVWIASGRLDLAGGAGAADFFVKFTLFYCHERLWARISFGRKHPPDFEI